MLNRLKLYREIKEATGYERRPQELKLKDRFAIAITTGDTDILFAREFNFHDPTNQHKIHFTIYPSATKEVQVSYSFTYNGVIGTHITILKSDLHNFIFNTVKDYHAKH